jgi:hypothetical protein
MEKILSLRKISLTTIVAVLTMVTMSSTIFSTAATAPVAFGQRIVVDSEQSVTVTTNGFDQDNNATIDRNTSSLRITQSPENGLDIECGGDLNCEILDNNTIVATNEENTTNIITDTLNALNNSLTQSLNQSSIPLPLLPFGDNDFDDLLNNDFGIFSEQEDLDSEIDEWVDRMLNDTLGDLQAPLQIPPDMRSASA